MEIREIIQIVFLIVFFVWNAIISMLFLKEKKDKEFLKIVSEGIRKDNETLRKFARDALDQTTPKNPHEE